jgi:hypothetical protein
MMGERAFEANDTSSNIIGHARPLRSGSEAQELCVHNKRQSARSGPARQSGRSPRACRAINDLPNGSLSRGTFGEISAKLSSLPEADLIWVSALLDVALRMREHSTAKSKRPVGRIVAKPTRPAAVAKKKN